MKERIMYVIQRSDGKFYWKHQSLSECCGCYGQKCKVKQVKVILID